MEFQLIVHQRTVQDCPLKIQADVQTVYLTKITQFQLLEENFKGIPGLGRI